MSRLQRKALRSTSALKNVILLNLYRLKSLYYQTTTMMIAHFNQTVRQGLRAYPVIRCAQIAPSDFSSGEADFPQESFVDFKGKRRSDGKDTGKLCADHFGIGSLSL